MKYFEELLNMNKEIYPNDNIRIKDLTEVYNMLDTFYSKPFNLEEFIKLCIKFFNMQIFHDGNFRTILKYLYVIIDRNNYNMDIDKMIQEHQELRDIFPVMYDLNDEISDAEVHRITKYISKKESNKEENNDNSNNRPNGRR